MTESMLDLRPMGIGEILDRSFRLYRDNFLAFFGILLVVNGSIYVVQHLALLAASLLGQAGGATAAAIGAAAAGGMAGIVALVLTPLAQGALTLAVSERFLGRQLPVKEAYKRIMPRFLSLLGAGFFVWVVVVLGMLLLILPGVYFLFAFLLTSVIVVLEGKKAIAAMGRSRELMRVKTEKGFFTFRSNTAKASIILLIIFSLQIVIVVIAAVMVALIAAAVHSPMGAGQAGLPWAAQAVINGVTTLLQTTTAPFYTIAIILLYYDIRIRFEGFDLEMMAKSLGQESGAQSTVHANQ